jgi:hypothetical protein
VVVVVVVVVVDAVAVVSWDLLLVCWEGIQMAREVVRTRDQDLGLDLVVSGAAVVGERWLLGERRGRLCARYRL